MKRYILLVLLFCGIVYAEPANAQYSRSKQEISVGLRGGIDISRMTFQPKVKQAYLLGPTFGAAFRYIEEKYFGFQLELNYSQMGWNEFFEQDNYKYQRHLSYLQIPFMTHLYFGKEKFRVFVNLGPQIGINIGDKVSTDLDIDKLPNFAVKHETQQYWLKVDHPFDYGIVGGLGLEFRAKRNFFLLEGRYYFGLGDIFNNNAKDYFATSSNQNISVAFTYFFRLK